MFVEYDKAKARFADSVQDFVQNEIAPFADTFDRQELLPQALIMKLSTHGYLGSVIPEEYGGVGLDMISFGLLNEQIGMGCSSTRTLITVQNMVAYAILRWGTKEQKLAWLPKIATGKIICAFGLTEPSAGSDTKSIQSQFVEKKDHFIINGHKKWISFGQIADLFLVFCQNNEETGAFLIEKDNEGLAIAPISGLLGTRASMVAEVMLKDCVVPRENMIGRQGLGVTTVGMSALDVGRYSVAWGCVGISQASFNETLRYSSDRTQFGVPIRNHQLIQEMVANMATDLETSRLLCLKAGYLRQLGDPKSIEETCMAKYHASRSCLQIANNAVQIHGALGCSSENSLQRFFRDAKVMEIIEGSNQIQQLLISKYAYQKNARK